MGYSTPKTLPDALRELAGGDITIVAGCTDYYPMLGDGKASPKLLDVTYLAGLRGISQGPDGWSIGAATTWSGIINSNLPPAFDGLKAAAREVGSVQIQNAGTIVGNLCNASPAADGVPPLLTLDATLELQSLNGTRHVALADFITGARQTDLRPDELVVRVHIADLPASSTSSFLKLGSRKSLVISIAMVSVLITLDDTGGIEKVRIAVGSCSAVAQRLLGLEAALKGKNKAQIAARPEVWSRHLGPLTPISDVRGSAQFRLKAVAELCQRAVLGLMPDSGGQGDA